VLQLVDLCPFVPIPLVKLAQTKTKRNAEKAAAMLMDEGEINKLFAEQDEKKMADSLNPPLVSAAAELLKNGIDLEQFARTNFLIRVLNFVENSIVTCGIRCLMCDSALEFPSFKPVICDKVKCTKQYQEDGMGFDLLSEIKSSGDVVDLLISFACAAVGNKRIDFFYPEKIAHWTDRGEELNFLGRDGKSHDHKKLQTVLDLIPTIKNMSGWKDSMDLKAYLDSIHELIFPLLVWLITTNRAYLRQLRPKERFGEIKTPYQYVMVSSSSKREQMFNRAKESAAKRHGKGSIYMFHGSPIGNWHSILRTGLKIAGGAGLGASGPAIWMANDFSTSHGYCTRGGKTVGWNNSQFGKDVHCMAIFWKW